MFLSYLITCHNEDQSLDKLLTILVNNLKNDHEIIVLDDYSDNPQTVEVLNKHKEQIKLFKRKLENNYGEQKNYGIEQCSGDWIFQIDADEYPSDMLLTHINQILQANENNEVIWLPRLNIFHGLTELDIRQWGWKISSFPNIIFKKDIITSSDEYKLLKNNNLITEETRINDTSSHIIFKIPLVNVPDYQSRLFRNMSHIRYRRRLHEKVEGHNSYTFIPPQTEYALFHEKSMEKQKETNLKYNRLFTENENKGYQVK